MLINIMFFIQAFIINFVADWRKRIN